MNTKLNTELKKLVKSKGFTKKDPTIADTVKWLYDNNICWITVSPLRFLDTKKFLTFNCNVFTRNKNWRVDAWHSVTMQNDEGEFVFDDPAKAYLKAIEYVFTKVMS
jgi:hypothetical protein